jgi:Mn2+/Fe2+ NRAMP family transporter
MAGARTFGKALGPGLLWAGAAVGVSHLVQSTRAGASYGFALLGLVIVANVFKYPAFSFGPRYAAVTGTSLLEGYRRQGRWALVLYALLTAGTMFTVQAAVVFVTSALAAAWLGLEGDVFWLSALFTALGAGLLLVGRYRWLDRIVKVVVVILTLSTLLSTALVLPKIRWGAIPFWPEAQTWRDPFLVALVGWMPSAFDISIWHSLWTLARREETKYAPSVKESLLDFNIGYVGTAILALCFVTLGAGVMFGSGESFADAPAAFTEQVIALYTTNLGAWSRPLIGLAAFTVMFSTTLTVIDGFPRAIASLVARFGGPESPDRPTGLHGSVYWSALAVLGVGSMVLIGFFLRRLAGLVDLATTLSFLTAPAIALLNHRAMIGVEVPAEQRPGTAMRVFSWVAIVLWAGFAAYFVLLTTDLLPAP